jgi:predicted RNA-binding Zn-ribbon protein involved in translation (DUF1610 family)
LHTEYVDAQTIKSLDSLDEEILKIIAVNSKYLCHEAKDRVHKAENLEYIINNSKNEYIIAELKKKFVCPSCSSVLDVSSLAKCKCPSCGSEVHDFIEVKELEIDGRSEQRGIVYKKCLRCGKKTAPEDYHWWTNDY